MFDIQNKKTLLEKRKLRIKNHFHSFRRNSGSPKLADLDTVDRADVILTHYEPKSST